MSTENALMSLEDKKVEVQVNKRIIVCKKQVDNPHVELAKIIFRKVHEKKTVNRYGVVMKLPLSSIKSIDGVECDAMITVSISEYLKNKIEIILRMEAVMVKGRFDNPHAYYHDTFYPEYNVCKIQDALAIILDNKIPNFKHSPMMCMFIDKDEFEIRRLIDVRLKNNGVDMCIDACAVCFEPTRAKTACNHTLCVPCADKIAVLALENMDESDDSTSEPSCPLCREASDFHITF